LRRRRPIRTVVLGLIGQLVSVSFIAATVPAPARAQTPAQLTEEEKLEQDFTDPLTTLPQLIVRDSFTPANYGSQDETNQFIVRPLIPRVPPRSFLPFAQLIRPTFSLVTVPSSNGGTRTEFGDIQLFDIAVVPWPNRDQTGLLWGVGPAFVFPTATSTSAGQGAWQAGPALGAIYKGIPRLLIGFIAQNPVSFAYTSPNRPPQNTFLLQPVFAFHLWDKWYLRSAEATWSMGWRRGSPTMLPLSMGLGRTFVRNGLPPMSFFVTGQWMLYRHYAPQAPQTTINFGMTVAFPEFRSYWGR
jgi:hypothetical protein